jgi:hypothetical protein
MNTDQLFPKDFRLKYKILASSEPKKTSAEINQLEISSIKSSLHSAKNSSQDVHEQFILYKIKCEDLEKNNKVLSKIIEDKDQIINKLWDDLLESKKNGNFNSQVFIKNVEEEAEISEEGHAAMTQKPVGKSIINPMPLFKKSFLIETEQEKALKSELAELENTCGILNEKLKETQQVCIKNQIELQELRERLKHQTENSIALTSQVLKANAEKENLRLELGIEKQELLNKIDAAASAAKRLENKYNDDVSDLEIRLQEYIQKAQELVNDNNSITAENLMLKQKIAQIAQKLESKAHESQSLQSELNEALQKLRKPFKDSSKDIELEHLYQENQSLRQHLKEITKKPINSTPLHHLFQNNKFELTDEIKEILTNTFGEDSNQVFINLQSLITRYKLKTKDLKHQVFQLTLDKSTCIEKIKELESVQTTNCFSDDSPAKSAAKFEVLMDPSPSCATQIELYKASLEKQKAAKRKAIAERDQCKEDLAYAILNISELQTKLTQIKLEAKEHDFLYFLASEAGLVESLINRNGDYYR